METVRNHAACARCGSSARHRHIALCIFREFESRGIRRLSDFSAHPGLKVLNTSIGSPVAKAFGGGANILCSEFFDGAAPGEVRNGVMHQDLQNLSFEDASLDLVVSEDVLEHVPDLARACGEIFRVLKRGGAHVFSIPFYFDSETADLFERRDGGIHLREPVEYHGDPNRGRIPCFTHIGYDFTGRLREMGYEVRIEISKYAEQARFGTFDCFTFIARRP